MKDLEQGAGTPRELLDLGCVTFVPAPEYLAHLEKIRAGEKHDTVTIPTGRCMTDCVCHTCGIRWQTDTGD